MMVLGLVERVVNGTPLNPASTPLDQSCSGVTTYPAEPL